MSRLHRLSLWAHTTQVADIAHHALDDTWDLTYTPQWLGQPGAFGLSPALPLQRPATGYPSATVRRFIENLLPEGRALDIVAQHQGVAKSNVYGLIQALGAETTGAFRFLPADHDGTVEQAPSDWRRVSLAELDGRIAQREQRPLVEWDGKVRLSVAGYQDKLLVYLEGDPQTGGHMVLPDYPLASTHILKPQPLDQRMPHMVVNEHYCMSLARLLKLPAAEVTLLRTPRPVLAVKRFDRTVHRTGSQVWVERQHIIDTCQACDLPVSFKYERHIGSSRAAALYRDGVGFERLFGQLEHVTQKAVDKLTMLRWALFQFIIGNCDAHGKNFSFRVTAAGLSAAPWYDLVSVVQYPGFSHELAMAFGDEFDLDQVKAFALADFAHRCAIERRLLSRETKRLLDGVRQHAQTLARDQPYEPDERTFAEGIAHFALQQATRLHQCALEASKLPDSYF